MQPTDTSTNRPNPPTELQNEALLEWHRIVTELESIGRLDRTDRALITVYAQHWQTHNEAARHVATYGAVIKHPNGSPVQNPFYKVMRETAVLLRGLLQDMGLNPTRRPAGSGGADDDLDI